MDNGLNGSIEKINISPSVLRWRLIKLLIFLSVVLSILFYIYVFPLFTSWTG